MSRFAVVNENNIVTNVIIAKTKEDAESVTGLVCVESEYVSIGWTYEPELETVIRPQPFESWELDSEVKDWVAPVEKPEDDLSYEWNEDLQQWDELMVEPELDELDFIPEAE